MLYRRPPCMINHLHSKWQPIWMSQPCIFDERKIFLWSQKTPLQWYTRWTRSCSAVDNMMRCVLREIIWQVPKFHPYVHTTQVSYIPCTTWWWHEMKMLFALQALCQGAHQSPVDFLLRGQLMHRFDVSFDVELNTLLNKESSCQWLEMPGAYAISL